MEGGEGESGSVGVFVLGGECVGGLGVSAMATPLMAHVDTSRWMPSGRMGETVQEVIAGVVGRMSTCW